MIFGYAKMAITLVMIIGIGGALTYVFKLRADNAVLKANNLVLEQSVESQKMVIEQQKKDFETILETNKKLTTLSNNCLLYTSPSPRDRYISRMPSSA